MSRSLARGEDTLSRYGLTFYIEGLAFIYTAWRDFFGKYVHAREGVTFES